jgi:hypothetical protein
MSGTTLAFKKYEILYAGRCGSDEFADAILSMPRSVDGHGAYVAEYSVEVFKPAPAGTAGGRLYSDSD